MIIGVRVLGEVYKSVWRFMVLHGSKFEDYS